MIRFKILTILITQMDSTARLSPGWLHGSQNAEVNTLFNHNTGCTLMPKFLSIPQFVDCDSSLFRFSTAFVD